MGGRQGESGETQGIEAVQTLLVIDVLVVRPGSNHNMSLLSCSARQLCKS